MRIDFGERRKMRKSESVFGKKESEKVGEYATNLEFIRI
jgi:hypothetical protein